MDFNIRLKNIRKRSKVTQKSIANHLGITLRTYQRYEDGSIEPPLSAVVSISKFFDLPIDCLLGNGLFANWEEILIHRNEILLFIKENVVLFPDDWDLSIFTESMLANFLPAVFSKITFNGSNMNLSLQLPLEAPLSLASIHVDEP
ncbi:MAG: helix-turn-helix domain-containing protein [Lachnospiraceae bacterium]|nr:helix-turn-helix domain-containing protein [Lachnospiraceae bacterium]